MENNYKVVEYNTQIWLNPRHMEDEINLQYNNGWEFVYVLPQTGTSKYLIIYKKRD